MEHKEQSNDNNQEANTLSIEISVASPIYSQYSTDFTDEFTTDQIFESCQVVVSWVHSVTKRTTTVVVILRSDSGNSGKRARSFLSCERARKYRAPKVTQGEKVGEKDEIKSIKSKDTGIKKCDCPFLLRANKISSKDYWSLSVVCEWHNHPIGHYLKGRSFAGRLTLPEEQFVVDLSKNHGRPKEILSTLQLKYPENMSTQKIIYNARQKHKIVEHGGISQMQYLLGKLEEHIYFYHMRRCEQTNMVKDLFYAHPKSVELLRAFLSMILMDCTYKTNRYKMPLLEIVGVTSTNLTFSATCVYLEAENEGNYLWACNTLKGLMDYNNLPSVVVTDREITLINVVELLRGMVSAAALSKIFEELNGLNECGVDPLLCGCVLRKTCDLSYAHELTEYVRDGRPISLDSIDKFWIKLDMETTTDVNVGDDFRNKFAETYSNIHNKLTMLMHLNKR